MTCAGFGHPQASYTSTCTSHDGTYTVHEHVSKSDFTIVQSHCGATLCADLEPLIKSRQSNVQKARPGSSTQNHRG